MVDFSQPRQFVNLAGPLLPCLPKCLSRNNFVLFSLLSALHTVHKCEVNNGQVLKIGTGLGGLKFGQSQQAANKSRTDTDHLSKRLDYG